METFDDDFFQSLRLSHFTIEHLPDAAFWINEDAQIQQVNQTACRMFGYSKDELLKMSIFDLDPKETKEAWTARWNKLLEKKVLRFRKKELTREGKWIPIELIQYYFELDGKAFSCSFVRDMTNLEESQYELHESRRQLLTLINNLPGSVYRCKPNLDFEFTTDWGEKITGYSRIENLEFKKFSKVHPEDLAAAKKHYDEIIENHRPGNLIYRVYCKNGDYKWVMDRFQGIYSKEGHLIAIEGFFADIDEQVKDRQNLKSALEEVERLKAQLEQENVYLRQEIKLTHNFEKIIHQSQKIKTVLQQVEQVAKTDATVLILGETGTGKELFARATHDLSNRCGNPLVKINCATLPDNLIESELFGHEKGAFTSATASKIGRFELANHGTIFLDEIGELPLNLQAKLLRVLQEGEYERLGDPKTHHLDVRIIAATNRDLKAAVENRTFREDLYYRLNVFPIQIPPLRERKEDILMLVNHFIEKFCQKSGKTISTVPIKVLNELEEYPWPGNVRELENIIERAIIISQGEKLEMGAWLKDDCPLCKEEQDVIIPLEEFERQYLEKVLHHTNWKIRGDQGAAQLLKINPSTLDSRIKKLDLRRT